MTRPPELPDHAREAIAAARLRHRRRQEHRGIVRAFDRLLGVDPYPDVQTLYGARALLGEQPGGGREPAA